MKVTLLVPMSDGNALSPSTFRAGDVVDCVSAGETPRHGDGRLVVYWLTGYYIGLCEGEFRLTTADDATERWRGLMERAQAHLARLEEKCNKSRLALKDIFHQLDDPWTR